jgi:NAD-dependent deacetylase
MDDGKLLKCAQQLTTAKTVVILTGAGVSKESGIPTFRDPLDGFWVKHDPRQLATKDGFRSNPKMAWQWSEYLRTTMAAAKPNPSHFAIAELERLLPDVTVLTQNIDELHRAAGTTNLIELHGSIHRHKCFGNCKGNPTRIAFDEVTQTDVDGVPHCPHCGAWIRPDCVWFNEILPDDEFIKARSLVDHADVLITAGTSGNVMPAASFPYRAKRWNDAFVIDVNPEVEEITAYADIHLAAPSGTAFPKLIETIRSFAPADQSAS